MLFWSFIYFIFSFSSPPYHPCSFPLKDTLDKITDPKTKHRKLVELNVQEQALNIFKTSYVQKRRKETVVVYPDGSLKSRAYPRVHAVVYDVGEGLLKKLDINFKDEIDKYRPIYDLY